MREEAGEPRVRQVDDDCIAVDQPIPGYDDWWVTALFFVGGDRLELLSLALRPFSGRTWPPPGVPLTTPVLRALRLEPLYRDARTALSNADVLGIDIDTDAAEYRKKPRPGPAGRKDDFYAAVAAVYVDLIERGLKPTYGVAKKYKIEYAHARDLVNEARKRGLLTRTKQGLAGGQLTAKAIALLETAQRTSKKDK